MSKFSILGDSNVRRHLNQFNCRGQPHMATAEILICGHFDIFEQTLRSVRQDSDACIISCLTNFLTASSSDGPSSSVQVRVEPVLREVQELLLSQCQEFPDRNWFLSPPMYRTTPVWYLDGLPEILIKFSEMYRVDKPPNLHLLPSFQFPDLEADGVHLLPYPGLQYVVSLFDDAFEALRAQKRFVLNIAQDFTLWYYL